MPTPDHEVRFKRNGDRYRCWIRGRYLHIHRNGQEVAKAPIPRRFTGSVSDLLTRLEGRGSGSDDSDG